MNIINKMRIMQDLTPAERQVINYILTNPRSALGFKLTELAKETYSSNSTITRLCHKLGMKSFSEFRLQLALEINSYLINSKDIREQIAFKKDDSISQIIEKTLSKNSIAINELMKLNSMESIMRVVNYVHEATQIDFYGRGTSNIVAVDMVYKVLRLGKRATAYSKTGEMIMNSRISTKDSIAFLISYSGETKEIIEVCENLNALGVTTISITNVLQNSLNSICTEKLFVSANETIYRNGAMASRIAMLSILDAIMTGCIQKNYEYYTQMLSKTNVYRINSND